MYKNFKLRVFYIFLIAFFALALLSLSGFANGGYQPWRQDPEVVAKYFIENSPANCEVIKSVLMSDCHGKALVYITTSNGKRYKVNLIFDRTKEFWRVESASEFGQDTIESN